MKVIIFIFLVILSSCSTKSQQSDVCITVDINNNVTPSSFFKEYRYISLETTEDNLIAQIDKIQLDSNRIYAMDNKGFSIFIFDRTGRYINKIQKHGRASDEYISLEDFVVYRSDIYCLSRINKKINVYSENGDFLKNYKLDNWYNNFAILNDSLMYLFSEDSNDKLFNFILYDYKNDIYLKEFDSFKKNQSYMFRMSPFNFSFGKCLVTKQFDNTVYSLDEEGITPIFTFLFNTEDKIPENYKDMPTEELAQFLRGKSIVKRLKYVALSQESLSLVYDIYYDGLGLRYHITSVDLKTHITRTHRFYDELYPEFPFLSNPLGFHEDCFVTCSSAISAIDIAKQLSLDIFQNDSLKETDNPVLFFLKMK